MSGFTELVRCTTLGLSVRTLDEGVLEAPVRQALGGAPGDGQGRALDAAAVYGAVHRARIAVVRADPLRLPPRSKRPLPPHAAVLLRHLFEVPARRGLLTEALTMVADRGMTLPPEPLLQAMRIFTGTEQSAMVLDLMDERARALFADHRLWGGRIRRARLDDAPPSREAWDEGDSAERLSYFKRMRRDDPAAARALLDARTWRKERASNREALVAAMSEGLGPDDEPFLEAALDDAGKRVRAAAIALLSSMAGSGLVRRAERLVEAHVVVKGRLLRAPVINCAPVERADWLVRDGLEPSRPHGVPLPVGRLLSAVGRIPPHRWRGLVGLPAAELVGAEVRCEGDAFDEAFLGALSAAARRWADAPLAEAVLAAAPEHAELLGVLDGARREKLILDSFDPPGLVGFERLRPFWPRRLSEALSLRLGKAVALAASRPGPAPALGRWAEALVLRTAPEAIPALLRRLDGTAAADREKARIIDDAAHQLRLRQELIRTIDEETP